MPKSWIQCAGEVKVVRKFLENFSGDSIRFLMKSFMVTGDRIGNQTQGHRFPFGPVAIISTWNFPLEIPALQLIGALIPGNRVTIKPDSKGALVMEQFLRMLFYCGLPKSDVDFVVSDGSNFGEIIKKHCFRSI